MLLGSSRLARPRASGFLAGVALLACAGIVSAQQSASEQNGHAGAPTPLPAVQSPEQAARPATPAPSDQAKNANGGNSVEDRIPAIKLGPGDLLEVSVYNVPELSTKARVNLAGDYYMPLIDYVHVAGLTQEEAQELIQKRLEDSGFVRHPHVTIFVDEATSQGVTIMGEVGKPGIYPDTVNHKLYAVISEAGGFSSQASRKIAIIRPNLAEPIRLDLPRNLADDLSADVEILPGDTINVPKAPIVYVVGDVGHPSGLLVDNGTLTVLQALALAGGANHTAKLNAVRIVRKTPAGMTETRVQLKKMLEAKIPDVTLQADDILFIPVSGARVLAGRTFEAAMSAATAVAIYSTHP
jgi:polysaccharide biosynthesis/export protein